jgi:hypothetical protein
MKCSKNPNMPSRPAIGRLSEKPARVGNSAAWDIEGDVMEEKACRASYALSLRRFSFFNHQTDSVSDRAMEKAS